MITRRLYYWLVLLHPPDFRRRFGYELLWIFDQAHPEEEVRMLGDAFVSALRQWLLRSRLPVMVAAILGAAIQIAAVGWLWGATADRKLVGSVEGLSANRTPAETTMLLLFMAGVTTAVVLSATALAVWFAFGHRRRRPAAR